MLNKRMYLGKARTTPFETSASFFALCHCRATLWALLESSSAFWGAWNPAWLSCSSGLKVVITCRYMLMTALNSCWFSAIYFSCQREHQHCSSSTFPILMSSPPLSPLCFEMKCRAGPSQKSSLSETDVLALRFSPRARSGWCGWEERCQVRAEASRLAEMGNHSSNVCQQR